MIRSNNHVPEFTITFGECNEVYCRLHRIMAMVDMVNVYRCNKFYDALVENVMGLIAELTTKRDIKIVYGLLETIEDMARSYGKCTKNNTIQVQVEKLLEEIRKTIDLFLQYKK